MRGEEKIGEVDVMWQEMSVPTATPSLGTDRLPADRSFSSGLHDF